MSCPGNVCSVVLMTTNTNPTARPKNICSFGCDRRLTPANRADLKRGAGEDFRYVCVTCYDQSGLENEHEDGGHEDTPNNDCPTCNEQAAAEVDEDAHLVTKAGKLRSARSHAECYALDIHPKTREGRQDCRDGKFTGDR